LEFPLYDYAQTKYFVSPIILAARASYFVTDKTTAEEKQENAKLTMKYLLHRNIYGRDVFITDGVILDPSLFECCALLPRIITLTLLSEDKSQRCAS
jgi:hypothetical protein